MPFLMIARWPNLTRAASFSREGEDIMSNTVLAEIVVPIVIGVALAAWITMVYRADKHPETAGSRRGSRPRREVIGGSFRGTGGRQLMPLPGQAPAENEDRQVPGTDHRDAGTEGS
jgi:hypothetical protein